MSCTKKYVCDNSFYPNLLLKAWQKEKKPASSNVRVLSRKFQIIMCKSMGRCRPNSKKSAVFNDDGRVVDGLSTSTSYRRAPVGYIFTCRHSAAKTRHFYTYIYDTREHTKIMAARRVFWLHRVFVCKYLLLLLLQHKRSRNPAVFSVFNGVPVRLFFVK